MTNKAHQNFSALNRIFFLKRVIRKFRPRNFLLAPKLSAKSPPKLYSTTVITYYHPFILVIILRYVILCIKTNIICLFNSPAQSHHHSLPVSSLRPKRFLTTEFKSSLLVRHGHNAQYISSDKWPSYSGHHLL